MFLLLSHLIGLPKPEKIIDGCAASFLLFSSTTTGLLLSLRLCIVILFTSFSYFHNLWDRGQMTKGQREPMDHAEPFLYRHVQRHEAPGETLQPKHGKQVLQFTFQRQLGELVHPLDSQSPKIESVKLTQTSVLFKCDLGLWRKFLQDYRSLRIRKIFLD